MIYSHFLLQVHGAWLPPWFAAQYAHYAEVVAGHWNKQGKPVVQNVLHKVPFHTTCFYFQFQNAFHK